MTDELTEEERALIRAAEEALAIARGEMEPAAIYVPPDIAEHT